MKLNKTAGQRSPHNLSDFSCTFDDGAFNGSAKLPSMHIHCTSGQELLEGGGAITIAFAPGQTALELLVFSAHVCLHPQGRQPSLEV